MALGYVRSQATKYIFSRCPEANSEVLASGWWLSCCATGSKTCRVDNTGSVGEPCGIDLVVGEDERKASGIQEEPSGRLIFMKRRHAFEKQTAGYERAKSVCVYEKILAQMYTFRSLGSPKNERKGLQDCPVSRTP